MEIQTLGLKPHWGRRSLPYVRFPGGFSLCVSDSVGPGRRSKRAETSQMVCVWGYVVKCRRVRDRLSIDSASKGVGWGDLLTGVIKVSFICVKRVGSIYENFEGWDQDSVGKGGQLRENFLNRKKDDEMSKCERESMIAMWRLIIFCFGIENRRIDKVRSLMHRCARAEIWEAKTKEKRGEKDEKW